METTEQAPAEVCKADPAPPSNDACVDRLVSRVVGDVLWAVTGGSGPHSVWLHCVALPPLLLLFLQPWVHAQEAAPEAATETVDKVEAVPKAQEAAAPKPSGWRWGKAIFAIAVGVVASGVVVAVHHGQRGAPMRSARK